MLLTSDQGIAHDVVFFLLVIDVWTLKEIEGSNGSVVTVPVTKETTGHVDMQCSVSVLMHFKALVPFRLYT